MNQQGPPPKVEPLNIKKIILEIKDSEDLNTKDKKIKHLKKYRYMKTDYEFLYNLIINNDLNDDTIKEVKILNQMLGKIDFQLNLVYKWKLEGYFYLSLMCG